MTCDYKLRTAFGRYSDLIATHFEITGAMLYFFKPVISWISLIESLVSLSLSQSLCRCLRLPNGLQPKTSADS